MTKLLSHVGLSFSLSFILTSCCFGPHIWLLQWWRLWPLPLQWCQRWLPSCTFLKTKRDEQSGRVEFESISHSAVLWIHLLDHQTSISYSSLMIKIPFDDKNSNKTGLLPTLCSSRRTMKSVRTPQKVLATLLFVSFFHFNLIIVREALYWLM